MAKAKKPRNQKQSHFSIREVQPLTENHDFMFREFRKGKNLLLHGLAGTGKTYNSFYLALDELLNKKSEYDKIIVIRSVVPSRDMGFLPGTIAEKARVFEDPYVSVCNSLFGRGDAYDILKHRGMLEFTTSSHLRGMTFNNSIIIIDEIQNMTFPELDTIITRVGSNCRLILCGDYRQTDLIKDKEKSGVKLFMHIINKMESFTSIEFDIDDIVRSGLVKDYILAKIQYGNV